MCVQKASRYAMVEELFGNGDDEEEEDQSF